MIKQQISQYISVYYITTQPYMHRFRKKIPLIATVIKIDHNVIKSS